MSGYYVGIHGRNTDILVMTTQGVIKGNIVHRKSESERWDRSELVELKGVPWALRPRSAEDLEHRLHITLPETTQRLTPTTRDGGPRQLYVRKKDLEKEDGAMDYTPGCRGCEALMVGLSAVAHNSTCRGRLEQRLAETEEGRKKLELADVEKRLEGKEKKAKQAVTGLPDPTEGEVRSSMALGQPETEEGETSPKRGSEGTEGERTGKTTKAKAGEKRPGTSLDDLYYYEIGDVGPRIVLTGEPIGTQAESPAASAGGAASNSLAGPAAGPNPPDIITREHDGTPTGCI